MSTSSTSVDISGDGGVLKTILRNGSGDELPTKGSRVEVHYVGTLTNGDKFDSSRDRDSPFTFTLGRGEVIKGWDIGVATMKIGELSKFSIRGDYAYGERGSPPKIGPNATLIFEVELLNYTEDESQIKKTVIKEGDSNTCPVDGCYVTISYVLKYQGQVIEEKNNHKIIQGGRQVVIGIEKLLESMQKGEIVEAKLKPKWGYGQQEVKVGNIVIPPGSILDVHLELVAFEVIDFPYEMTPPQLIDLANRWKSLGNDYYKNKNYANALAMYENAQNVMLNDSDFKTVDQKSEKDKMNVSIWSNMAATALALKDHKKTLEFCEKVLKTDKRNVKAYFRKGKVLLLKDEYEQAKREFQNVLDIDQNNQEALFEIKNIEGILKKLDMEDRKRFQKALDF